MTTNDIGRPVHSHLQRSALAQAVESMVSSPSAPSPFGMSAGSGSGCGGSGVSATGQQQAQARPSSNAPIRPNALINFNFISLAPPATIPSPIASPMAGQALRSAPTTCRPQSCRRASCCLPMASPGESALAGGRAATETHRQQTSRQAANHQQQHLYYNNHHHHQPKALSSSGLNDSLPSQILPHLFVGSQEQTNRETINKLNIKYILSLGLLPMIINSNNNIIATNVTSISPTSPTTRQQLHRQYQQSKHSKEQNQQQATGQQQQQQLLLPPKDSSIDFKIRIRSNTPTTPTSPSLVTNVATTTATSVAPTNATSSTSQFENSSAPTLTISNCSSNHSIKSLSSVLTAPATTSSSSSSASEQIVRKLRDENEGVKQVRSVHCKCINISDNSDQLLSKFFDEAYIFIEEARRKKCNILIHCLAGISRSPTIAIAYLMRVKSLHWKDAYDLVKQCRPLIDPNLNFMGQLRIYNKSLRNEHSIVCKRTSSNNNSPVADDCHATIKSSKTSCCIDNNLHKSNLIASNLPSNSNSIRTKDNKSC